MCQSSSAFATHARVVLFIKNFPFFNNLDKKRLAIGQSPTHFGGGANDDIDRERRHRRQVYFDGHVRRVPRRHDDKNIDITVFARRAVGVGAEEDNLVRPEALCDDAGEFANLAHRNIGPAVPAWVLSDRLQLIRHRGNLLSAARWLNRIYELRDRRLT